jgi:hypothetical protein
MARPKSTPQDEPQKIESNESSAAVGGGDVAAPVPKAPANDGGLKRASTDK